MYRDTDPRLPKPAPAKLLRMLTLAHCLDRLGCGEMETARLLDEWLDEGGPVVGRVSGPARDVGAGMAAAA